MKPITSIYYKKNRMLFNDLSKISYANVKGEALSYMAYGSLGNRNFNDIDILISKAHLNELEQVLSKHGYESASKDRFKHVFMKTGSHQIVPYHKKIGFVSVYIDINFDIFWGEYEGKRIDISQFLSDTVEMNIYGVEVKTLSPLKSMVQLILHHYKDMNSIFLLATKKSIKYSMFKDVYCLLKNNLNTITLEKLYNISAEYEIIPYVYYVLYHTGMVFRDSLVDKYTDAFRTPEGEKLLNCYGLCSNELKVWKYDFETRLKSENLYDLIIDDLTEKDKEKIAINKQVFLEVLE